MQIQALYAIEARGRPPDERRRTRQTRAGSLLADMKTWRTRHCCASPRCGDLEVAIRYALVR